jgi:predicted transcriptional regulator
MRKTRAKVNGIVTISEAEMQVLRAIRNYVNRHRASPTFDEVAKLSRRSKSTIRHTISRLIQKSLLDQAPGKFRNLVVTEIGLTVSRKKIPAKGDL